MTFTKISVLVPTRLRLDRLQRMIASFRATAPSNAELVFRVDDDDLATQEFLADQPFPVVVGPRLLGYQSMPNFFNEMFPVSTGDVVMCGNDDMIFKTEGWPKLVLATANRFPDGLFDIGVSTFNADHYPFYTISRFVAEQLGFLIDPRIFWADIFWRDVMGAFGRCVLLPEVEIEHDWAGFQPDTVFEEARQQDFLARDPTYWSGTHTTCVAEAVARLRGVLV